MTEMYKLARVCMLAKMWQRYSDMAEKVQRTYKKQFDAYLAEEHPHTERSNTNWFP